MRLTLLILVVIVDIHTNNNSDALDKPVFGKLLDMKGFLELIHFV